MACGWKNLELVQLSWTGADFITYSRAHITSVDPAHILISFSSVLTWRRKWHPTPVLLPGNSPGWRSLVGCSPWGCGESDTTEQLHFSLSCIGEGNGSPLQCSCLENPRDGGAWWAAIYGVAQSQTRLKRLSSSSSSILACQWGQERPPRRPFLWIR